MKIQSVVLCLLMAVPAFAQTKQIVASEISNYFVALRQGGVDQLSCGKVDYFGRSGEGNYLDMLYKANLGTLNTDGAQPVLTLSYLTYSGSDEYDFAFTTSSDYKKVLKIDITYKTLAQVNEGNIIAPNVVEKLVPRYTDVCQ